MRGIIRRHGSDPEPTTDIKSAGDAAPLTRSITADPSDNLGTLAYRAYGANTPEFRERIRRANPDGTLGTIRIPY